MAKSATKVTTKKSIKKPVTKAIEAAKEKREVAAEARKGVQDASDAIKLVGEINRMLVQFATAHGMKVTRSGTATFKKSEGKLTLPKLMLTNLPAEIKKGTRVALNENAKVFGTVNKVSGKMAYVQFDNEKQPGRYMLTSLIVVNAAPEAKRKNVLPTLAQGVKVVPEKEYAVKGGGSAMLSAKREGRTLMWVIEINKGKGQGWSRYGIYGSARKGTDGDVNRRFAEQQLRKITAGVKGAKKTNPIA